MQYKTIVLELLQQRPELHDQLRSNRTLLPTMEHLASELKAGHQAWQALLAQANPGSDTTSQIASVALEMALKELEERSPSESPSDANELLSLDAAMAFLRRHTLPA